MNWKRLAGLLLGVAMVLGAQQKIACNVNAIAASERPRYMALIGKIRLSIVGKTEVADGYRYELDEKAVGLGELGEWMQMERLCCPFLEMQVSVGSAKKNWMLRLTGPAGVKALLDEEFPKR